MLIPRLLGHGRLPLLLLPVLFAVLLLPRSAMEVAAKIGYEMHVVSFVLGPAVYRFGGDLLPGVDYFTQYSVGLPYVFSFVMGPTADQAMVRYVHLVTSSMAAFFVGLSYLLWWLMGSWRWAAGTAATVAILQFHVERTFFDPSSYVLRYPLLIMTFAAIGWWAARHHSHARGALVGISVGLSLFLNTETGVYQLLAAAAVGVLTSRLQIRSAGPTCALLMATAVTFITASYVAFGPGVLSKPYVIGLVQPFLIYGGGFGAWAVDWRWGWHVVYNVIAPGLALVTIAWSSWRLMQREVAPNSAPRVAVVFCFASMAVMMSAKYNNMSLVGLWHTNAIGFIVCMAWWARQVQLSCAEAPREWPHWFGWIAGRAGLTVASVAAMFLATVSDPRNPAAYALEAYWNYPSLWNTTLGSPRQPCRHLSCSAPRISSVDVALVQKYVPATQRAAIFGWHDWAYLIEAQRASWFHFLPSHAIFTQAQLAATSELPDFIFLPNVASTDLGITQQELARTMLPRVMTEFRRIEVGTSISVWRRAPASAYTSP